MHLYGFWDRHVHLNGANHGDAINLSFILDEALMVWSVNPPSTRSAVRVSSVANNQILLVDLRTTSAQVLTSSDVYGNKGKDINESGLSWFKCFICVHYTASCLSCFID